MEDPSPGINLPLDASVPVPALDAGASSSRDAAEPGPVALPCGFALSLDAITFASIPRVVADDFTLEAWIKTATSRTDDDAFYSLPVFDADVIGQGMQNDFVAGVLNGHYAFGVGSSDTTLEGSTVVTTDEWIHVAVTRGRDTGQMQVIVNGILDVEATVSNEEPLDGSERINFGGASLLRKFIGSIDEVRIWTVVRTVDEIASTMRSSLSGSESDLVGYYTFEDRGPNETADLSATGEPVTLSGNPTYVPSFALCPAL